MLRLLVLSLGCAAALKVDQAPAVKPALRLRGGVDTSTLVKVGAGLFGLSAAQAWISPKAGMDGYGVTNAPADGLASFRGAACWQMAIAYLLLADVDKVNALSHFVAAAAIFASFPAFEVLGGPKMPGTLWCIFLCTLGKFALDGKVNPWVAVALWVVNGAQWYFAPDMVQEMYQVPPVSVLAKKMLSLQGGSMLVGAAYVTALTVGKSQAEAFAAAFAVNCLTALKFALTGEAEEIGAPRTGPLAWAGISAVLAGLALKQ